MEHTKQLEALLFVAGKPLTFKKIADQLHLKQAEVKQVVQQLAGELEQAGRGIQLMHTTTQAQLVTVGAAHELVANFVKDEMTGELTKPSIETLTIIAYRGPVSKLELERIRGINCSLILRNLLLRGLIEVQEDKRKRESYYSVTLNFLKHLGLASVEQLPDYAQLHANADIDAFLASEA